MTLKDVTFVVFTRDRRDFALRLANFWSRYDVKLIVFDNGSEEWSLRERSSLGPDHTYIFSPGHFVAQMKMAADYVSTPYVVRIDDDNMFSPHALRTAVDALVMDTSLIGITVQAAAFRVSGGECQFTQVYGNNLDFENIAIDPLVRVQRSLIPYHVFGWYAVQRLEAFRVLTQLAAEVQAHSSCPYALEIAEEIGYAWLGPSTSIDALGLFRSQENPPVGHGNLRRFRFHDWYTSPEHNREVEYFHQSLIGALELTESQFRQVRGILDLYVERAGLAVERSRSCTHVRRWGASILARGFGVTIRPESQLRRWLDLMSKEQWLNAADFYAKTRDPGPQYEFARICMAILDSHASTN